jgi:hypothetical protein
VPLCCLVQLHLSAQAYRCPSCMLWTSLFCSNETQICSGCLLMSPPLMFGHILVFRHMQIAALISSCQDELLLLLVCLSAGSRGWAAACIPEWRRPPAQVRAGLHADCDVRASAARLWAHRDVRGHVCAVPKQAVACGHGGPTNAWRAGKAASWQCDVLLLLMHKQHCGLAVRSCACSVRAGL